MGWSCNLSDCLALVNNLASDHPLIYAALKSCHDNTQETSKTQSNSGKWVN